MKSLKRGAPALVLASAVVAISGCNSKNLSIPDEFCRTPMKQGTLSPLVPEGNSLTQKYEEASARPGAFCKMSVDGHQILLPRSRSTTESRIR